MARSNRKTGTNRQQRIAAFVFIGTAAAIAVIVLVPWNRAGCDAERGNGGEADAGTDEEEGEEGDLPETPSRAQVQEPLATLAPLVATCGKQGGVVRVHFTISGRTGSVTEATVAKQFAGTDVAKCAAGIVERAQFPRFRKKTFDVVYPFRLSKTAPADDAGADTGTDGGRESAGDR